MDDIEISGGRQSRAKKENTGRNAALERLKKARQGEKIKYELADDDDLYEEVEVDDDEDFIDEDDLDDQKHKTKKKDVKKDVKKSKANDTYHLDTVPVKTKSNKNIVKDKLTTCDSPTMAYSDQPVSTNKDIRSVFANVKAKKQPQLTEAKSTDGKLSDDDLMNEIMQELSTTSLNKPKKQHQNSTMKPALNSSPSVKRKTSPLLTRPEKRIELDDNLIEYLKNTNDSDTDEKAMPACDVSMTIVKNEKTTPVKVKEEPCTQHSDIITDEDLKLFDEFQFKNLKIKNEEYFNDHDDQKPQINQQQQVNDSELNSIKSKLDSINLYWLDAYEDAYGSNPGCVYLFGKMQIPEKPDTYISACCIVKNIPRVIFVLPRKYKYNRKTKESNIDHEIKTSDVVEEIDKVLEKYKIFNYRSKIVEKNYAFDSQHNVPYKCEYLQIEYSPEMPQLPQDIDGETFQCIFGTQTAFLETFLLNLKLKGPSWLQLSNVKACTSQLSWCKIEFLVDNYKSIQPIKDLKQYDLPTSPPLTALTFIVQTALNKQTQEHEIVLVCGLINQCFYLDRTSQPQQANAKLYDSYFCALNKPSNLLYPFDFNTVVKDLQNKFKIEICTSERALLSYVLCKLHSTDADVIIGHDLFGFNFDILLNRCLAKKVSHWSRLGKLKRNYMPKHISTQRIQIVCSGRLLCDIMLSSKELLTKCKSFDLNELIKIVLKEESATYGDNGMDFEDNTDAITKNIYEYYSTSQLLLKLIRINMLNAQYIYRICSDLNAIQLAYQITCIAGNVLSRTLIGGRSERNELLLLHAFHEKNFILPDKNYNRYQPRTAAKQIDANNEDDTEQDNKNKGKKPTSYTGGLVLEPKVGFYDHFILLLDFNSLYPSIIQEYNICFTTIQRPKVAENVDLDDYLENSIKLPSQEEKAGILPSEIKKLVDSRKLVKQLLQKDNLSIELKMQYDIRQKALKLTANSMYGCLGFENSRFYCKPLAALITRFGRTILMKTKDLVENKKIEVIYGDTDSIMINTNINDYEQVIKMGSAIKTDVNKLYRHLEIGIDGVFKCLLLLKKKKYAALTISKNPVSGQLSTQKEVKGLDIVRRDWCGLAKEIGEKILDVILSGMSYDLVLQNINNILYDYADRINKHSIDKALYEIHKQLNRNPEDYNESNHQSHVLVALRFNRNTANNKKFHSGDVVSYIICEDGTNNSATQRAYSKEDLEADKENLKIDLKYYFTQQIHPIVSRLCEPIESIDAVHIATCLGLDPAGFKHKNSAPTATSINLNPTLTKQQQKLQSYLSERENYKNCTPFKFTCPSCKTETTWKDSFVKNETDSTLKCVLEFCSNEACTLKPINCLPYIKNNLSRQLSSFIKQYYQFWLYCEDSICAHRTKRLSCKFTQYKSNCIECDRSATSLEYTHSDLYYQMKYFKYIFDTDSYKSLYKSDANQVNGLLSTNQNLPNAFKDLREFVSQRLKKNTYGLVNLRSIFTNY